MEYESMYIAKEVEIKKLMYSSRVNEPRTEKPITKLIGNMKKI